MRWVFMPAPLLDSPPMLPFSGMTKVEEILAQLESRGLRDTGPRRAVVEAVCARPGSFTTQEIADELAAQGVGRATVFRAIGTLQELGYLSRLHVGEECHRYTLCDPHHHHHLVCTSCGQVYPLESCSVEAEAEAAARRLGFSVRGHHVDVFGHCAACTDA
jgi:Fur family ferric uptake transcriptional regulator